MSERHDLMIKSLADLEVPVAPCTAGDAVKPVPIFYVLLILLRHQIPPSLPS
jgi:hypothetical protein